MPSFDIVSQLESHELENAINNTKRQIDQRFDFRGSKVVIEHDAKAKTLKIEAEDRMKIEAVGEILRTCASKRGLDLKAMKFEDPESATGASQRQIVKIQEGLDRDTAKKIVKLIKETKLKVQAAIQGEEVRVSGKKIDDLQSVQKTLREADLDVPLQFTNQKA